MTKTEKTNNFVKAVQQQFGQTRVFVTRQEIKTLKKQGIPVPSNINKDTISRGVYRLPTITVINQKILAAPKPEKFIIPKNICTVPQEGLIPGLDPTFVPFGAYWDTKSIIESGVFLPIYLVGPTRSGKTLIPIQICSELKKNLYRVNITIETDESDLLGGYKLINGETVWEDGPAIKAAEDPSGGLLLLDEIDLGSNKLLCLQPLLEGSGIYIKKINRWVRPVQGFNIIATANTKGRGSEDGKYIGANVMNEAMLERFPITYEQGYAEKKVEMNILKKNLKQYEVESPEFVEKLCQWAQTIRKTNDNGGVDETISTGRLVYIVKTYIIFGRNRMKAIKDNIARFDLNTQTSFLDAYTKIDEHAVDGPDNLEPVVVGNSVVNPPLIKKPW
jgi:hypothetical protein